MDIKKIVIAAVAVVVVIAILSALFGGGYKKPVKKLFDLTYKGKVSNVEDMLPDEVWEEYADEFDMEKDELIEEVGEKVVDFFEETYEDSDYGEFKKVKYDIVDSEKVDKDDLEEIAEAVADMWDVDEDDVTAAYELEIEGEAIFEDDEVELDSDFYSVKVNGKWYLFSDDGMSMGDTLIMIAMFGSF